MRVLSFIPALLLAATSFVTATHTVVLARSGDAVTSCEPGTANDAPLQSLIYILTNATAEITLLSQTLDDANSGVVDDNLIAGVVTNITDIIANTVTQLKALPEICLDGLDLLPLWHAISLLLCLVLLVLSVLLCVVSCSVGSLLDVINTLLQTVNDLLDALQVYDVTGLSDYLSPVLGLLSRVIKLLAAVTAKN